MASKPARARQRPRGRPHVVTPAVQKAICKRVEDAGTLADAAVLSGIQPSTLWLWRQRGREDREAKRKTRYSEFLEATERAQTKRRVELERRLRRHGTKNWKALAWLLERTEPKRFGLRIRMHVEKELSDAIERLMGSGLPEDQLERALAALAGGDGSGEADPDEDAEGYGGASFSPPGLETTLSAPSQSKAEDLPRPPAP